MSSNEMVEPWEDAGRLVAAGDAAAVEAFFDQLPPGDAAHTMSRLGSSERRRVLELLDPESAAQLVDQMADVQAAEMLDDLAPASAAAIVHELASNDQADLLANLKPPEAEAILAELSPEEGAAVRALADYPPDVAGGLMMTEYLAFAEDATVGEGRHRSARRRRGLRRLRRAVSLRRRPARSPARCRAAARPAARPLGHAPRRDHDRRAAVGCRSDAGLEELEDVFDRHSFVAVPVVGGDGRMLGVVSSCDARGGFGRARRQRLPQVPWHRRRRGAAEHAAAAPLGTAPVLVVGQRPAQRRGRERHRHASGHLGRRHRLGRLPADHLRHERLLGQSGGGGEHARALPRTSCDRKKSPEYGSRRRVWGCSTAACWGCCSASVAWLWQGNVYLGLVVGAALALNTVRRGVDRRHRAV